LTFTANKGSRQLAEHAAGRLPIGSNILLATFADRARFAFALLLEFGATISTFHHWEVSSAFLTELLALAQLLEGVPGEALATREQRASLLH